MSRREKSSHRGTEETESDLWSLYSQNSENLLQLKRHDSERLIGSEKILLNLQNASAPLREILPSLWEVLRVGSLCSLCSSR